MLGFCQATEVPFIMTRKMFERRMGMDNIIEQTHVTISGERLLLGELFKSSTLAPLFIGNACLESEGQGIPICFIRTEPNDMSLLEFSGFVPAAENTDDCKGRPIHRFLPHVLSRIIDETVRNRVCDPLYDRIHSEQQHLGLGEEYPAIPFREPGKPVLGVAMERLLTIDDSTMLAAGTARHDPELSSLLGSCRNPDTPAITSDTAIFLGRTDTIRMMIQHGNDPFRTRSDGSSLIDDIRRKTVPTESIDAILDVIHPARLLHVHDGMPLHAIIGESLSSESGHDRDRSGLDRIQQRLISMRRASLPRKREDDTL